MKKQSISMDHSKTIPRPYLTVGVLFTHTYSFMNLLSYHPTIYNHRQTKTLNNHFGREMINQVIVELPPIPPNISNQSFNSIIIYILVISSRTIGDNRSNPSVNTASVYWEMSNKPSSSTTTLLNSYQCWLLLITLAESSEGILMV